MSYSIVIVTYNRCELLKECLECALNQQLPPTHIIVINNASTDDTKLYLQSLKNDCLVIRHLKENMGGAGGFYHGLRIAHDLGDEWHLIIDDDAMLRPDFVEEMMQEVIRSRNSWNQEQVQCLAGTVITAGEIVTDHRQLITRPGLSFKKIPAEMYEHHTFYCDTASFCGLMLSDKVVGQIGLPEKNYFIWYDDTEYCLRIRKYTRIKVVTAAVLDHKVAQAAESWPRHYTWKDRYGIRNRILMVRKHGTIVDRMYNRMNIWINAYLRNVIFNLVHLHKESWKFEIESYKMGVKEARLYPKYISEAKDNK